MGGVRSNRNRRFTDGYGPTGVLIGPEMRIEGELRSRTTIDFAGTLEGFISGDGLVRVRRGASITGNVSAEACVVEGRVDGDLQIRGTVELRPSCHVTGDITARSVAIADGAVFEGGITMDTKAVDRNDVEFVEQRNGA
jgi:cytoskeletal protein CcmA (bactofilin family)